MLIKAILERSLFVTIVMVMVTGLYTISIGLAYGYPVAMKFAAGIALSSFIVTLCTSVIFGHGSFIYMRRKNSDVISI
jgi:hypothetical protein